MEKKDKIEIAYSRWKQISLYTGLIARLKMQSSNQALGNTNRIEGLEKEEETQWSNYLVITMSCKWKQLFDLAIAFLVFIELVHTSYTFFVTPELDFPIMIFLTISFGIDIVLRLFQEYESSTGTVKNLSVIMLHYLRFGFFLDFLSTFPFFFWGKGFCWLRFLRLFRFSESSDKIINFVLDSLGKIVIITKGTQGAIKNLLRYIIGLFLLVHMFACFWVNLGKVEGGWISIGANLLEDKSDMSFYVTALYWECSVFVSVGYGDFSGKNSNDYIFTMVNYLIGLCMFSYLLSNLNNLIQQLNTEENLMSQQAEDLEDWLIRLNRAVQNRKLSNNNVDFINSYMKLYWSHDICDLMTSGNFMSYLPPTLRQRLLNEHLCKSIVNQFGSFFKHLSDEITCRIITKMTFQKMAKYNEGEEGKIWIQKAGIVPHHVLFVINGSLGMYSVDKVEKFCDIPAGSCYGYEYILFDTPSFYSVKFEIKNGEQGKNESALEIYKISKDEFLNIIKDYPTDFKILKEQALNIRKDYRNAKRKIIKSLPLQEKIEKTKENSKPKNSNNQDEDIINKTDRELLKTDKEESASHSIQEPMEELAGMLQFKMGNFEDEPVFVEESKQEYKKGIKEKLTESLDTLNHNQILSYLYEYDSEQEYGKEDVFEQRQNIKHPQETLQKFLNLRKTVQIMKRNIKKWKKLKDTCWSEVDLKDFYEGSS